jgi:hypothetical protein
MWYPSRFLEDWRDGPSHCLKSHTCGEDFWLTENFCVQYLSMGLEEFLQGRYLFHTSQYICQVLIDGIFVSEV